VTYLLVVSPEFKNSKKEFAHMESVDFVVDEFENWQSAVVQVAHNVEQTFKIVLATGSFEVDHGIRSKHGVAVKVVHFFLDAVNPVFVEDFTHQSEVNQRVALPLVVVAYVLKLQVSVHVPQHVDDLDLLQ